MIALEQVELSLHTGKADERLCEVYGCMAGSPSCQTIETGCCTC